MKTFPLTFGEFRIESKLIKNQHPLTDWKISWLSKVAIGVSEPTSPIEVGVVRAGGH